MSCRLVVLGDSAVPTTQLIDALAAWPDTEDALAEVSSYTEVDLTVGESHRCGTEEANWCSAWKTKSR
jgi:hypothetical protein